MGLILNLLAVSCLASAIALGFGGLLETRHSILLWRSRRVQARDLKDLTGIFDVRGHAHAAAPLRAPLTGRACLQYTVVMERAQPKSGQKRDGDPDLITFVDASPFVVDDGTGKVHVDLREHRVPVTGTSIVRQQIERLTVPLEKLLALRLKKPGGLWCMNRNVTATEAALVEGAEVSLVGRRTADGEVVPLHVTAARTRVVAMQGLTRSGMAFIGTALLLALWLWLK